MLRAGLVVFGRRVQFRGPTAPAGRCTWWAAWSTALRSAGPARLHVSFGPDVCEGSLTPCKWQGPRRS
jgi:hypothetical protein